MKIKNPASRVFYFQSIGAVDDGTMENGYNAVHCSLFSVPLISAICTSRGLQSNMVGDQVIKEIGLIAAIVLPLWNVPLIVRMVKRKSSQDISLSWVFGVWFSLLAMLPSGLVSQDVVWKTFNITNFVLFTCVVITACICRKKGWGRAPK